MCNYITTLSEIHLEGGVWWEGSFAPLARVLHILDFFANMHTIIALYVTPLKSFKFTLQQIF